MRPNYLPPWWLRDGFLMTVYIAKQAAKTWRSTLICPELDYQSHIFTGTNDTPIFALSATPAPSKGKPKGTIVATYGITGSLENQWYLHILARKAVDRGYAVILFDWRCHGKTAELSPALTSDGIYEGADFVHIAAQAKALGFPAPFYFTGYSLGAQLALWGIYASQTLDLSRLGLTDADLGGGAVLCPSVESDRSLRALPQTWRGRLMEQAIVTQLRAMVEIIVKHHPKSIDPERLDRVTTIRGFDKELIIEPLGFQTTEDYYRATSPIYMLPNLHKPTAIIYAADDPMFERSLIPELVACAQANPAIDLCLTQFGGHVGYISNENCQAEFADPDCWWAWNRILDWYDQQTDRAFPNISTLSKLAQEA